MSNEHPGELEQLVLFAILRLGDEAYGVAIRDLILERAGRSVSPGGIYTVLRRLERRGLIESREAAFAPPSGGRRRIFYRLSAEGAAVLRRSYEGLRSMAEGTIPKLRTLEGDA